MLNETLRKSTMLGCVNMVLSVSFQHTAFIQHIIIKWVLYAYRQQNGELATDCLVITIPNKMPYLSYGICYSFK